jgi:uncharacterized membrane protein
MEILIKLISAGIIMGALDYVWLGFVAKKMYYSELGKLLLDVPNMVPAVLFYAIYVIGTVLFVVNPALEKDSWLFAAGMGALFGFICYATYDLTNLSTVKGFSLKITIIDLAWGAALTAIVATGTFFITKWFAG